MITVRASLAAAALFMISDANAVDIAELSKCRNVADTAARAQCYDKLVDNAVSSGEKSPPPFISKPAPAPEKKTVELSKVGRGALDRLVLVTTEGETWIQTQGEAIAKPPASGASMTIKKGAMGGFFCSVDRYTSFRCTLQSGG